MCCRHFNIEKPLSVATNLALLHGFNTIATFLAAWNFLDLLGLLAWLW